MSNISNLKTCKYCGVAKPRELFPANPLMTDLRESKCKKCRAAYDRDKRAKRILGNIISHF
jgi:hypothetical protein